MMSKKIRLKKGEVFKEIEGYGDRYYISNKGRLWSNISGRFIGSKNSDGYIDVSLYNDDGEQECTSIHRLVGRIFVPNDDPENKVEINHKNYIRDDNRAENLEWVTKQENMDYSYERNSESLKKLWEDEDFRKRQVERSKKQWEDEDFRKKMSEAVKKNWEDEDFRKKYTEGVKKLWEDEDYREKHAERVKKQWEDEDFRKIQLQKIKKQWEDEDFRKKVKETNSKVMKENRKDPNFQAKRLEGLRKALCKPLLQYTKEGELVSKFSSRKEASEKTGIGKTSISAALRGKTRTAGGFRWEYDQ